MLDFRWIECQKSGDKAGGFAEDAADNDIDEYEMCLDRVHPMS